MDSCWNPRYDRTQFDKPILSEQVSYLEGDHPSLDSVSGGPGSLSDLTESDLDATLLSDTGCHRPSEYACAYCLISKPTAVVKCLICNRWFCNSQPPDSHSHIVHHLIRAQHNQVMFHSNHPLVTTPLSCSQCGSRNIFGLGFVPSECDQFTILCKQPCGSVPKRYTPTTGSSHWQPIIWETTFLNWIIEIPDKELQLRARQITQNKINSLEELWIKNPLATYIDLENSHSNHHLLPTRQKYQDAHHYQSIFEPLLRIEADHERTLKESKVFDDLTVRWVKAINGKLRVYFNFPFTNQKELMVTLEDILSLKYIGDYHPPWEGEGTVIKLPSYYEAEIGLELTDSPDVPVAFTEDFSAQFIWNSTKYDRMHYAMRTFVYNSEAVSNDVYLKLMGHDFAPEPMYLDIPHWIGVANLPDLNPSQISAIKSVLKRPFSLIQGPPGTGKTVTSATLVYHLVKLSGEKVLVCAPSNIAVDHLAEKIHRTGLKVVRVCAKSRELHPTSVDHLTLHHQIRSYDNEKYQELVHLKRDQDGLTKKDEEKLAYLMQILEKKILREADVVMCTCVGAGDARLNRMKFPTVLIDEATQATEPECLIPLTKGCRQVVLVGDHQQLGPVVVNGDACRAGLNNSLFERLLSLSTFHVRLQVQYRMHPKIAEFPSDTFYDSSLVNGVTASERTLPDLDFPWPDPTHPQLFLANFGLEEKSASGTSYLNPTEAAHCESIVSRLLTEGIAPERIGIITPYEGQRSYLATYLASQGEFHPDMYKRIDLASVDAFQGREKDFIIVSCVRSNPDRIIGFLRDPRRLNVSITRARYGLIMIGNPVTLSRDPLWHKLLSAYQSRSLLVEGSLDRLQVSTVDLADANLDSSTVEPTLYDEFLAYRQANPPSSHSPPPSSAPRSYSPTLDPLPPIPTSPPLSSPHLDPVDPPHDHDPSPDDDYDHLSPDEECLIL